MLKDISLRYKLIFGGMAAILIPFFIVGIIIYIQLSNSLLNMNKAQLIHLAKDTSVLLDAILMQEIKLATAIAADPDIIEASKTGIYHHARKKLKAVHERLGKKHFTLLVTDKHGIDRADALFSQQEGVDLSDRNYFKKAQKGRASVGGPFFPKGSATPGQPIIVVAAPIQEKNTFYGIVAIPFETDYIVNAVLQKKLGKTGFAFLINAEGLVLVHPKKEIILKSNLFNQPDTQELKQLMQGDKTGTAVYVSAGTDRIAGMASMELVDWTIVFSQDRDEIISPVNRVLSTVLISGIIFLLITILIIITFSEKISTPIQNVMEMTKHVTQHASEIIIQIGLDRKIVFANPAFEKTFGKKSEEIIGTEPELSNPNNIPANVIWKSLESGIPWSGRIILQDINRDTITLDVMILPVKNPNGTLQGYIEIGRDITGELKVEKHLQQSQRLEAIGTLAGGIAHDFNNILFPIIGLSEMMMEDFSPDSPEYENVKNIFKASMRGRDLVKEILSFSRASNQEMVPVSVQNILREALKLSRASIPASIEIKQDIQSDCGEIIAVPTQIHQITMNLITNAYHAIEPQKGIISVVLEEMEFGPDDLIGSPLKPGFYVKLSISDTGSGIDPSIMEKIYDPYFTTKAKDKGTGLGLAVVYGLVKDHQGDIKVYSELGKGTTVNVFFPIVNRSSETALIKNDDDFKAGTEKILVVDDEESIVAIEKQILERRGYQVTTQTNSLKALEIFCANPNEFDLVVTDMTMPHLTGDQLARKLLSIKADLPIIICTGFSERLNADAAEQIGIKGFLMKPLTMRELVKMVQDIFDETKINRHNPE